MTLFCWNCGESLADIPLPVSRHANCPACFEVLRCCRMCRYFNASAFVSCDHERAEPPVVKESANFCDFFKPANRFNKAGADRADSAKSEFASLFGNIDGEDAGQDAEKAKRPQEASDPAARLNSLFDD